MAKDLRIPPKPAGPESVAEDDHIVPALLILGCREIAADRRMNAQSTEEVRSHVSGQELLGVALACERRYPVRQAATFSNDRVWSRHVS